MFLIELGSAPLWLNYELLSHKHHNSRVTVHYSQCMHELN